MCRFIIRHKVFFIIILSLLFVKVIWVNWSCWGNGSFDSEKNDLLLRRNYLVGKYVVMDYLVAMQKFLKYDDVVAIERFIRSKQWWDTIDGLDRIVGNIAFIDSRINNLMLKWSEDDDFWVRRIAIDHQLCRKFDTNVDLLEKIIVNNFGSSEFFINKAIGWSLRDYSKSNPDWVRSFIERYRDKMNPLSLKEASKYL